MILKRLSPRTLIWWYAAAVAALLGYFMFDIPVQLSDSFLNILTVQRGSMTDIIIGTLWNTGYLRPLLFAPIKLVFALSGGHYHAWFRGVHVAQMALTVGLFVALLRVRSWTEAAAAPLAIAGCVTLHTFAGTIREAFPVNGYLTIVDGCLLVALICSSRPRWWSSPVAIVALVVSALTAESGLLVWVVIVAAFVAGWRGVGRGGLVAATACVAAYLVARFFVFHVGTPSLIERSTGFGLQVLDPPQVIARFGVHPLPFYAYNVAASMASVLFAEPRGGVFWVVRWVLARSVQPWIIVNLVACTSLTVLIARHILRRRDRWLRWDLADGDRLTLVFLTVLVANATMGYVYTKDVIMGPAGVFFALAGYVSVCELADHVPALPRRAALVASICLAVCAASWGIKAVGIHYSLRESARDVRNQWSYVDDWLVKQEIVLNEPRERAVKEALRADALWRLPARPRIAIHWPWPGNWFDNSQ